MEARDFQATIRHNYELGKRQAEDILILVKTDEDRHLIELEAARRMEPNQDVLMHSWNQGYWHTVSTRPLSLVRLELEGAIA